MVRRIFASLLAVCITALYLAMPVKAATRPMVTADGYYPGTGANPQRYYYCAISGTDTSFTSEMYYALDGHKVRILTKPVIWNVSTGQIEEPEDDRNDFNSVSYSASMPSSYGSGSFYMDVMSKYYLNLTTYIAKLNF